MVRMLVVGLALLAAGAACALGAAPAPVGAPKAPPGVAAPARPAIITEEQRRASEIAGLLGEGKVAEAQAAGEAFLKSGIKDAVALAEAQRVVAECLRKKGEWRAASAAYVRVRDRCEKNSEDYIRYDAIADILRASPNGVYSGPGSAPAGLLPTATATTATGTAAPAAPAPKTLADDDALADALARVASMRTVKIKQRVPAIKRGRTPQEALAAYAPAVNDAREMFILGPNAPADAPHEAAAAAGARLKELATPLVAQLQSKFEVYRKKFDSPWSLTNVEKADIQTISQGCKDMMEVEKSFQQSLPMVAGKQPWPDQERLAADSQERMAAYSQLSLQYVVPRYTTTIIGY